MENFRNYESIWLYNISEFLGKFVSEKTINIKDSYTRSANNVILYDLEKILDNYFYYGATYLSLELLTLATENFKNKGLNFGNPKVNTVVREVKAKLPSEFSSLNGQELLKLLRSSIAHNSESNKNIKTDSMESYNINFQKKGLPAPANSSFSYVDMIKILSAYDQSRELAQHHAALDIDDRYKNVDELLKAHKKFGSFARFIKYENAKGEIVDIDKYQENAYLRFLIKHKNNINKFGNHEYFLSRYFPAKENRLNQYEYKYHLSTCFDLLMNNYDSMTCTKLVKELKTKDFGAILPFIDKEFLQSVLYSSIAFNMFSSRTNDELVSLSTEAGCTFSDDEVRHIRNSLMHGRYFFNFKDGFEIYDGKDEMQHYATLKLEEIYKIYHVFIKHEKIEIMQQRARFIEDYLNEME